MHHGRVRASALLVLLLLLAGTPAAFAGEAQPPGPPWKEDWREAHREALREGRPIFIYFTKHF